jgi:hypothetical protein
MNSFISISFASLTLIFCIADEKQDTNSLVNFAGSCASGLSIMKIMPLKSSSTLYHIACFDRHDHCQVLTFSFVGNAIEDKK